MTTHNHLNQQQVLVLITFGCRSFCSNCPVVRY